MPTSSDSIPAVALEQKGKRRATESDEVAAVKSTKTRDLQSAQHASIDHDGEDMGEFEDPWEDEYDSSEEGSVHMDALSEDGVDQETQDEDMTVPEIEEEAPLEVYLPGQQMDEDEELVVDNSAYDMLHQMGVEWPCLSFDVLPDALGMARKKYPMTAYLVAGSQADSPKNNALYVMKMSSLHRTKHDDDDEASEDEDENDLDEDPILEYKTIPHFGGVNRVRVMPHQDSQIVAVWSDQGHVGIYDVSAHTRALDSPGLSSQKDLAPVHTVKAHKSEGYAMDWSRQRLGHLLTGDSDGHIYLTTRTASAFVTEETPFLDHTSSVEDIQFSPSQSSVFASASADMTIKIWDLRTRNRAQLSVKAHDTDVNVISWNRHVDYLLASGSDSGEFSIWDLRSWPKATTQSLPIPAASFKWHKAPITSVDWHPIESSVLAVSGADHQVTLWDLALERDAEEEAMLTAGTKADLASVPPQLLFIHQGQKHVKEIKWHPQAPGVLVSTSLDGFNIFKTINS